MKLLDATSYCNRSLETSRGLIEMAPNKNLIIEIEPINSHMQCCFVELL